MILYFEINSSLRRGIVLSVSNLTSTFISGSSGARYIDTYINTNAEDSSIPATIITNEQYQSELNDRKRTMRVYSKNVISEIESSIKRLINTNG